VIQTALSDRERQMVERIAAERGVTFEEVVEQLAKEGLAKRVRKGTGRLPAKVYEFRGRNGR
jgi:hypothetical protein